MSILRPTYAEGINTFACSRPCFGNTYFEAGSQSTRDHTRFRVGDSNIPAHTYLCLHPECGLHAQVVCPPPSYTNSAGSALHEPA